MEISTCEETFFNVQVRLEAFILILIGLNWALFTSFSFNKNVQTPLVETGAYKLYNVLAELSKNNRHN